LTLAATYLVAALNVTFRDLQHIVGNLITLAFFLTPIIYALDIVPERFRDWVLILNPMAALVVSYQAILIDHTLPAGPPLLWVAAVSVALLWWSTRLFE